MALIEGWLPPTRENYELILTVWKWSYPIVCQLARSRPSHAIVSANLHVRILLMASLDRLDTVADKLVWHGEDLCDQRP